jgi:hypothetical protein
MNCLFESNGIYTTGASSGGISASDSFLIQDNIFYNNKGYGIYVPAEGGFLPWSASGNIIKGNSVYYTQSQTVISPGGIYISGRYNRVIENNCTYNSTYNIRFSGVSNYNVCINNSASSAVSDSGSNNKVGAAGVAANDNAVLA